MNLFDAVSEALADPERETAPSDVEKFAGLLKGVLGASPEGGESTPPEIIKPDQTQAVVGVLGSLLKNALTEKKAATGPAGIEDTLQQLGSGSGAVDILKNILGAGKVDAGIQQAGEKSGLNPQTIMAMAPVLMPVVLKLLKSGQKKSDATASADNPVLNAFLDSDRDGDVDLADALRLAGGYLGGKK